MSDHSGRYWLVYNGEIYNHVQIRRTLENEGAVFRTHSDTEVLLHSLIRWGMTALTRIEGMYAFAFWDSNTHTLLLVRDRFGIKPLYYTLRDGILAFGSEIKALLELEGLIWHLNKAALLDYLTYRYIPGPGTIYREIQSLPAAHAFRIQFDGTINTRIWSYWDLTVSAERRISLNDAAEELDSLLDVVCREHLISDVPIGTFLSGGIDSGSVVVHSQANSPRPMVAVTVGFKGMDNTKFNEIGVARQIASQVGAVPKPVEMDFDVFGLLPEIVKAFDEPMADPSALPVYLMMRVARGEAKVMLSGDGGDEVFGGYNRYRRALGTRENPIVRRARDFILRTLGRLEEHYMKRYLDIVRISTPAEAHDLLNMEAPALNTNHGFPLAGIDKRYPVAANRDVLTQWQHLDIQTYLVDDNLKKADRMGMAWGVEVRVPLLDRRIVEFGLSLPWRLRFDGIRGKTVLRESLRKHLPERAVRRGKAGFKVPLSGWIRSADGRRCLEGLLNPSQPIWDLLHPSVAKKWVSQHFAEKKNRSEQIWSLLVLNEWLHSARLA